MNCSESLRRDLPANRIGDPEPAGAYSPRAGQLLYRLPDCFDYASLQRLTVRNLRTAKDFQRFGFDHEASKLVCQQEITALLHDVTFDLFAGQLLRAEAATRSTGSGHRVS